MESVIIGVGLGVALASTLIAIQQWRQIKELEQQLDNREDRIRTLLDQIPKMIHPWMDAPEKIQATVAVTAEQRVAEADRQIEENLRSHLKQMGYTDADIEREVVSIRAQIQGVGELAGP